MKTGQMAAVTKNFLLLFALSLLVGISVDAEEEVLKDQYYSASCPDAESVIKEAVIAELDKDLDLAAGLIRLQFHDCFVQGCDASLLLDGSDTEKNAGANNHIRGYEVIDAAKTAVEAVCPGVVSCADIVAYAARDSTVKLNGASWVVQGGRTDGSVSSAETAESEIPLPSFTVSQLIDSFSSKGLSTKQMVILSGAHTVGVAHCESFINRLYNFNATYDTDPSLNSTDTEQLKKDCPQFDYNPDFESKMDTFTPAEFDSKYYEGLTQGKGLFTSDQSLFEDDRTQTFVNNMLSESPFKSSFGEAMRAMAAVGVQTGGQIRKNCREVNI